MVMAFPAKGGSAKENIVEKIQTEQKFIERQKLEIYENPNDARLVGMRYQWISNAEKQIDKLQDDLKKIP